MNNLLERFELLARRARTEIQQPPAGGLADGVMMRIAAMEACPQTRWPLLLATAGYVAATAMALFWVYSAYSIITHPLAQFFNSASLPTF